MGDNRLNLEDVLLEDMLQGDVDILPGDGFALDRWWLALLPLLLPLMLLGTGDD